MKLRILTLICCFFSLSFLLINTSAEEEPLPSYKDSIKENSKGITSSKGFTVRCDKNPSAMKDWSYKDAESDDPRLYGESKSYYNFTSDSPYRVAMYIENGIYKIMFTKGAKCSYSGEASNKKDSSYHKSASGSLSSGGHIYNPFGSSEITSTGLNLFDVWSDIPIFPDIGLAKKFVDTGEYNEDDLLNQDDEYKDDSINLPQDKFAPPTDAKFTVNGNIEIINSSDALLGNILDKFSCSYNNINTDINEDIKVELQYKSSFFTNDSPIFDCKGGTTTSIANTYKDSASVQSSNWFTLFDGSNSSNNIAFSLLKSKAVFTRVPDFDLESKYVVNLLNTYSCSILHEYDEALLSNWCDKYEEYRIRFYFVSDDGKKYSSDWVNYSVDWVTGNIFQTKPNTVTKTTNKDNEQTESKYYNDKSGDSNSIKDTSSFFGWLSNQLNAIAKFFASITSAFNSAGVAGKSFIALFKEYNSWLPAGFITLLTTGLIIAIFLRIVGR